MKYLGRFNKQLRHFRESGKLSVLDISKMCQVDPSVVEAWEEVTENRRCYPTLENILDLCFKSGSMLDSFIDAPDRQIAPQLELPGLTYPHDADLSKSIDQLDDALSRIIPNAMEQELLRRFRRSDKPNRELILQLIAN